MILVFTASDIVSNCDLCINGTTVGLNALITHRGGKTGLICTAGHEDSIEIRNGHKEDGFRYDPEYPAATMLVPRYLRKGVRERVISDGSIRTPMHEEDVRAACELFLKEGVETVAISFVWSVLNTAHEQRAAEIVREMMPRCDPDRRQRPLSADPRIYPHLHIRGECLSGSRDAANMSMRSTPTSSRWVQSNRCATSSPTVALPLDRR